MVQAKKAKKGQTLIPIHKHWVSHREITAILIFYEETIVYCIGGHIDKVDVYTCTGVPIYRCTSKVVNDLNEVFLQIYWVFKLRFAFLSIKTLLILRDNILYLDCIRFTLFTLFLFSTQWITRSYKTVIWLETMGTSQIENPICNVMTIAYYVILTSWLLKANIATINIYQRPLENVYTYLVFYSFASYILSPLGHCWHENYF